MILCPYCNANGRHEEKGYIVEEVRVERLEFTCCDDYGYRNILINKEHVTGNGQDFYYTKKEASKIVTLRNKKWKQQQDLVKKNKEDNSNNPVENYEDMIEKSKKNNSNNPVKGLSITLYPIEGK
jgi:hypothetical protein